MKIKFIQKLIDIITEKKSKKILLKLSDFEKSHYYLLLDNLLSRDINTHFNINCEESFDVLYGDVWTNIEHALPCKTLTSIVNYDGKNIPQLVVTSGIGAYDENYKLAYIAQFYNLPFIVFEDGFLRSATTWADKSCDKRFTHGISFTFDNQGVYFDATRSSLLENMLNDENLVITDEQIQRAKNIIKKIIDNHLTKYNHQPVYIPNIGSHNKKVLVVDQSYGDMSISRGMANDRTFEMMLDCAIKENPDADIIVKTHPDTMTGRRGGYYTELKPHGNVYTMTDPINPISMIEYVDKVYVCTTQLGFEALMCGKEVHVFGMPFYAGWGLANERQTLARRKNKRSLEEVFYISYIMYTRYYNPYTMKPCEIEEAIDCLLKLREEYRKENGV